MAQNILHRRSSLTGKTPTTQSLLVGEIGINTYDGRVFIHKSGSVDTIEQIVTTNSETTGSIIITGTGSFGELIVSNDINLTGGLYAGGDIVGNGDIDIAGAVTASVVTAEYFYGDGSGLTGVTASMRPDDYDFNSDPFAGSIGYIQGSGSLYKVATVEEAVEFRYNDVPFATFTTGSTNLYGIGDILSFSSSVASRLTLLEEGPDAGEF
jgi:hypothetical protein